MNKTEPEKKPSTWRIWLLAARPHTLTAAFAPIVVGYNICKSSYNVKTYYVEVDDAMDEPSLMAITCQWFTFCVLIQIGTNLHNDYADFVKGADDDTRVGQARATQKGWLTPEQTCRGCDICLLLATSLGLQLANMAAPSDFIFDWFIVGIVLTSAFNAVAYTGGPYPLGYIGLPNLSIGYSGLGDIFVFLYFGLVATMVIPYLMLREPTSIYRNASVSEILLLLRPALSAALPVGWLATAIIVVNNLRDRETDVGAGKRTLAVRFGSVFARLEYAVLVLGSFIASPFLLPSPRHQEQFNSDLKASWYLFLPWLSIFLAVPQLRAVSLGEKDFAELNPHVGGTAKLQLAFCLLFSATLRIHGASISELQ